VARVEAHKAAVRVALGATYVVVVGATFRTYLWITPLINQYVAGFPTGDVGGPILIAMAISFVGLLSMGVTYTLPFIGTYLVSFVVEAIIEGGDEAGAPILGTALLAILTALVAVLAWISFLGGWQSLTP
jgi:hypothetical protein